MAQVKDPACGMMVEQASAAGSLRYEGQTYYFCSPECLKRFEANPAKYVGRATTRRDVGRDTETRP
jgi:P-type Cu+ transporter